jgi:hypothetical protein
LKRLIRVGGRLSKRAGRNLHVLLYECIHHVGRGEAACCQSNRVEPDTHGVFALAEDHHVAHAGHSLEGVLHINVEIIGDELARIAVVESIKAGAEHEIVVGLGDGDAGGVHLARQAALCAGDPVLHVHCGNVQVVSRVERGGDGTGAAVGARRADVAHALDTVD